MKYHSTRGTARAIDAAQAIAQGIAEDGGLFVPQDFPTLAAEEIKSWVGMSYFEKAKQVFARFLTDFTPQELEQCIQKAYSHTFPAEVTPTKKVNSGLYVLELWHGPTCAFKDVALQILPHLLLESLNKINSNKEVVFLVATSGDTGKAALEGFKDIPHTEMIVFYPDGGVSPMQYRQMATQEGENVLVYGVKGNFDDTQTGIKKMFTDSALKARLAKENYMFSSANSINLGRLLPQVVYYFEAYLSLVKKGEISFGDPLDITVPTGNFGDILAGYYAKKMGLPLGKFICASNKNNVLTDFINTGVYNKNRPFYVTNSPSMDIIISSNLERLLYDITGNTQTVTRYMRQLAEDGQYQLEEAELRQVQEHFYGIFATEEQTLAELRSLYDTTGYLCDTHTAVACYAARQYRQEVATARPMLLLSTANPYKFAGSILPAFNITPAENEFEQLQQLHAITSVPIPQSLVDLQAKPIRFTAVCGVPDMPQVVTQALHIAK